jgi:hypothetical protein
MGNSTPVKPPKHSTMQIEKQALTPLHHATILGNVLMSDQNPVTSAAQGAQLTRHFKWHEPCLM